MMIQDKDLEFLQYCTNPDLFDLCDIITTYGNYQFRGKYDLTNEYKRCDATYLRDVCRDIASELGMNAFRHSSATLWVSITLETA